MIRLFKVSHSRQLILRKNQFLIKDKIIRQLKQKTLLVTLKNNKKKDNVKKNTKISFVPTNNQDTIQLNIKISIMPQELRVLPL